LLTVSGGRDDVVIGVSQYLFQLRLRRQRY
jgi:hypothetical protein